MKLAEEIRTIALKAQDIREDSFFNYGDKPGYHLGLWDSAKLAAQELGYGPEEAFIVYMINVQFWNDIQDELPTTW